MELHVQAAAVLHSSKEIAPNGVQWPAGVEALNLAKWPIGGGQEQAIMASLGHHMWRLSQLDLADTLVSASH